MSARNINPKDFNRLMAYLDGALSTKERARFERQLAASEDLKRTMLEQKRLKAALRALPIKKAPRDFMLTPEMVKQRKSVSPMFPAFRLASMIATVLLVVVFAGEYLLAPALQSARSKTAATEAAAVKMPMASSEATEEPLIFWNAQPATKGMGGGADTMAGKESLALPEAAPPPVENSEEEVSTDQVEATPVEPSDIDQEALILGLNTEEGGQVISQSVDSAQVETQRLALTPIQWVKIGLGALALGLGITALVLRRKR